MRYGNKSIINSTVSTLNYFQTIFHGHMLRNMSPKNWNSLFLITFLRTLNNSLCVFTIIVNKYVIGIYIYTYIYIYIYVYIYYIYIYIYVCICKYIYLSIYLSIYLYLYLYQHSHVKCSLLPAEQIYVWRISSTTTNCH